MSTALNIITQTTAGLAAAVHILVFVWETILFDRPGIHWGIFKVPTGDVPPVRLWSFNVGLYNLFLGSGTVIGLVTLNTGHELIGHTLLYYTCSFMVLAGIGLGISDRLALSRPKGAGVTGTIAQITPPLITLISLSLT